MTAYAHPEYLTDVQTLYTRLGDANLRIFDTAVQLIPQPGGTYQMLSGRADYESSHIPSAGFIDLAEAWAVADDRLRFTLPPSDTLASAIGQSGIGAEHDVVLYSSGHLMWATRAWWLLHHAGHQRVSVLNGNFTGWQTRDFPTESGTNAYAPTTFSATPRDDAFVGTTQVEDGMHGKVCTINALTRPLYEGSGDFYYTRPGHIPGSLSLPFDDVLENEHFLPAEALHKKLDELGILNSERVITYCGGGIAATLDGFACKLLGQDNVGVYDGSLSEWVQDDSRPLTVGPDA